MQNPMRHLSLMSQTMLETTIKHPFTDDDDHPDTDAFYQTLLFEIDELIDTTNFRESSISLTYDENKTRLVLLMS
jgi:hypothetical protein